MSHVKWGCLLLLAALACARSFEVPERSSRPLVTGLAPFEGFYLDPIVVSGTNFDPVATNNEVIFPGGPVALGEELTTTEDGVQHLLVAVPFGPTSGQVVVQTPRGRSDPFGECGPPETTRCFYYKGGGHPYLGTTVGEVRVVHRPPGIVVAAGDVFLASSLFRALLPRSALARGDPPILLPARPLSFAAAADGAGLLVGYDYEDDGVQLYDAATHQKLAAAAPGGVAARFLTAALPGTDAIGYAVGDDLTGATAVLAYERNGAVLEVTRRSIAVIRARGAVGAEGGALVVSATWYDGGRVRGGAVVLKPLTSDPPVFVALEEGVLPHGPVARLQLADRETCALAADDGTLRLLDLEDAPAWKTERIQTGAVSVVAGLLAVDRAGQPPLLVATRALDGVVSAWDAATGEVAWAMPIGNIPSVLTADAAGLVYIARDDSNEVEVIEAPTGRWLQRFVYDTGLGNPDECACGPVAPFEYIRNLGSAGARRIFFMARRLRHLVLLDSDNLLLDRPQSLGAPSRPLGLVKEPLGKDANPPYRVWVLHEEELAVMEGFRERVVASALPAPPLSVAFAPQGDGRVVVGAAGRVDVYRRVAGSAGFTLERIGGVALPTGAALKVLDLRVPGDGPRASALWTTESAGGLAVGGARWTLDQLGAGGAPDRELSTGASLETGGFIGAVNLLTGPLLMFREARTLPAGEAIAPAAVRLQDDLSPFASSAIWPSVVKETGPIGGTTADGRYFFWTRRLLRDNILRVAYGAPAPYELEGFKVADWSAYRLPAPFATPTTDPSGEWLYVPVPGLDSISIFQ
jgi:hypothetical protein